MPGINPENAKEAGQAVLTGLIDINATDPIEGCSRRISSRRTRPQCTFVSWLGSQSKVLKRRQNVLAR
jgi:hypothetical protein